MIKELRTFRNTAEAIYRSRNVANISQNELGKKLGYKNAQFISNMERGKCGIPAEKIFPMAKLLKIDPTLLAQAQIADYEIYLYNAINSNKRGYNVSGIG